MQSRIHEVWARFLSSTLKDDLQYTPSECFETFPFPVPEDWRNDISLETSGKFYYEFRADLMVKTNKGLTQTYNHFHDPLEAAQDYENLRHLHAAMDHAVLDAYGWTDIQPKCEFIPEFDDEEEEDENGRPKKKKYRYRWPDEIRDEVLARLLELNRQRALEEGQIIPASPDDSKPANSKPKRATKKKTEKNNQEPLFAIGKGEA